MVATLAVFVAALLILQSQKSAGPPSTSVQPIQVEPKIGNAGPSLTGIARVIDGDTIDVRGTRVRLDGIDAPEAKQTCEVNDKSYPCGLEATEVLIKLIGASTVECTPTGADRNARIIAKCKIGATDVGDWMVSRGWAIAFRKYSMAYVGSEDQARSGKLGMWSGKFTMPEEWRKRKREGNSNEQ